MHEAAGAKADDAALARMLASGDFDAAEYDRAMAAAFGEDYYEVRHGFFLVVGARLSCFDELQRPFICHWKQFGRFDRATMRCLVLACVDAIRTWGLHAGTPL